MLGPAGSDSDAADSEGAESSCGVPYHTVHSHTSVRTAQKRSALAGGCTSSAACSERAAHWHLREARASAKFKSLVQVNLRVQKS